jgi:hypothetical protein
MPKPEFKKSGADKLLTNVLDERDENMRLVRYEAARMLARTLQDEAPDKTVDVLLHMLNDKTLHVNKGFDVKVVGDRPEFQQNPGADARSFAAPVLILLGRKASSRKDVEKALRDATKDPSRDLQSAATDALKKLNFH